MVLKRGNGNLNKLFSKFNGKDFNEEIEQILDEKQFNEEVQSLILSIFYKINNSYDDYKTVKQHKLSKEEFLEIIKETIKKYCNKIEIIDQSLDKNTNRFYIDKNLGKIKCIANDDILLFCIFNLINIENEEKDLTQKSVYQILEYGNALNFQETIRSFNGWSWQDTISDQKDLACNIIFQDIIMILGYDKTQELINNKNIIIKLAEKLEKLYGGEYAKQLEFHLLRTCVLIMANESIDYKNEFINYFEPLNEELSKLENKEELINFIANKRKEITDKIREIDKKLNNITYLTQDFEERNKNLENSKKFFSISALAEMYEKQRKDLLIKMKEYNKLVEPKSYIKKREELENKIGFYKQINLDENIQENIIDSLINLQKAFLNIFNQKIEKCNEKKKIIDILYNFRYYKMINFSKDEKIFEIEDLKEQYKNTLSNLIKKAQDIKAIEKYTNSLTLETKIIDNILSCEIISLNNIYIQISDIKDENNLYNIQYFDGTMLIKEEKIELHDIIHRNKKGLIR